MGRRSPLLAAKRRQITGTQASLGKRSRDEDRHSRVAEGGGVNR